MFACVHQPSGNDGSCANLATYLSKDNGSSAGFFSASKERISYAEVVTSIDHNVSALGVNESKFYMLSLNPSHAELCSIIGRSVNSIHELTEVERELLDRRLVEFTREAMNAYALNFGRDKVQSGRDLLYYARIETSRIYKPTSENIAAGERIGAEKQGLNYHVHVIVSRKSADGKVKLSPQVVSRGNDWMLDGKVVRRGFNHENWKLEVQNIWEYVNGISNERDRYIPFIEDSFYHNIKNEELKEVLHCKYNSVNAVLAEMKLSGYSVKHKGDRVIFSRPGSISIDISKKDLRARETLFTDTQKSDLYKAYLSGKVEAREMSVFSKEKVSDGWKKKTELYLRGQDVIIRFRDAEMAYAKLNPKAYALGKMPEDMKQVFNTYHVSSYKEYIPYMSSIGYVYRQEGAQHVFTKGDAEIRLYHSELKALEGVKDEIKRSIAERLDLQEVERLKGDYIPKHGLSVEERTIEGKDSSYYVVRDKENHTVVNLGDIRKEHFAMLRGEHIQRMSQSACLDIRELSKCKRMSEGVFIAKMEEKGYSIENLKYEIRCSKDGHTFSVAKGDIRRLSKAPVSKDELKKLWLDYQNGALDTKLYPISYIDNETKETITKTREYLDNGEVVIPKAEAVRAWSSNVKGVQYFESLPPVFKEALGRGEYYTYQERFAHIEQAGYSYRYAHGEVVFTSSQGDEIRLRYKDLASLNGVSSAAQKDILERVSFQDLYRKKDRYTGHDGISVERRDLSNGTSYYVVQDRRNDVTVKLSDLRKTWEHIHGKPFSSKEDRVIFSRGSSIAKGVATKALYKTMPQEVREATYTANKASSMVALVANPKLALKKKLMQAVKKIISSSFKEV